MSAPAPRPRRVLVIDDSTLIRHVVQAGLGADQTWAVCTSGSGAEGIESAMAERPDVILLDVEMPGIDGPGTLTLLRAQELTQDIPVLFLTGHSADDDRRRLRALGAAGVIAKPFDPAGLGAEISRQLGWSA